MAELASWDEVFDTVEKSKSGKQSSSPHPKPKAEPESWDDVDAAIKKVESGFSPEYLKELRAAEAVAQIGIDSAPLGVQEWGAAAALPPEYRRAALERSAELFKERGPMKGAGNIKRTAVAVAQGGVDWGMPAASFFAPKELQLDGDQEAFRQALISVREGSDPSLSEGSIASTIQQAARMAVPMVGMGVAGRASGTMAKSVGLGAVGTRIAQGVGVTAAAYPMAVDQSYRTMIAEGLDPEVAAPISRISGLFEGAIESAMPDPFKVQAGVLKGSIRRIVAEGVRRAGVQAGRIGIEASEEGAQAFTREAMYEVARAIDEDIPNQGLGQAFVAAAEEGLQSIGPLTVVMGPSITLGALGTARNTASRPEQYRQAIELRDFERLRRELANAPTSDAPSESQVPTDTDTASAERLSQLQEMRSKGFVSEEDAQQAGIEGKNRKERLANVDKEIESLQQGEPYKAWWDFGSGVPQGEIPAPPGLGMYDRLIGRNRATSTEQGQSPSTPTADPATLEQSPLPSTPPSGTATQPGAALPGGEAGAAVAGAGKGIVDGLYQSMYERLQAGKYPGIAKTPADDAVAAEHAREPFQTADEIRQFVNDGSRPVIDDQSGTETPTPATVDRPQFNPTTGKDESVPAVDAESKGTAETPTAATVDRAAAENEQPTVRPGKVGDMLAAGEVVTTSSGRQTTPFPKIDTNSDRKAQNTVKRVDKWLHENAIEEARSRGDDFNLTQFSSEDPARLPPASKDVMEEYLFGKQPDVVPPITKPLVAPKADTSPAKPQGLTDGFRALPPNGQAAFETEWDKGGTSIKNILYPENKNYRAEFEARTGIKLPKGVGSTFQAVEDWHNAGRPLNPAPEAKPPELDVKQPELETKSPEQPESKWQAETRAKLDAVPALKGSKFDMDEESGTVKVTRPDDIKVTIHFKSDDKIKEWGKKKGLNPEKTYGWAVKTNSGEIGIFVRSDANHTNVLNHEMMHALEFAGIVTKEEVEQHGGREAIADKYGKWVEIKHRKKDSVFQRIYDALEAVFSSQRRFFEEVGKRQAPQENLSKDKKSSGPQPPAGYKPLKEFTPVVTQTMSPDLEKRDNIESIKQLKLKPGDAVGYRVYNDPKSTKDGFWQYGIVKHDPSGSHAMIELTDGSAKMIGGSRLHRLEPVETTQASADQVNVDSGAESKVKPSTSDADLEALIEAEFDTQLGTKKPTEKLTGKKSDTPKPKTRIQKAADNARQEADDLWAELNKQSKDKLTTGLDPDLAKLAVRVALAEIKAGTLSFAAFVEKTVAKVPGEMLDKLKPYMEMAWKVAHKRGMTDDPAGKFDDVLAKPDVTYPDGSAYKAWMNRTHRIGDTPTSFISGHSSAPVREAAKKNPGLGLVITPGTKQYIGHAGDYSHIMVDNGAFSEFTGSAPFDPEKFFAMLDAIVEAGLASKVQFVVVPDKVGDWKGTNERWDEFYERVKSYGMPLAYVGQDGIEKNKDTIPWDQFDVFFIGGSTPWKLGYNPDGEYKNFQRPTDYELRKAGVLREQIELVKEAKERGKKVHMGRVNSWKRMEVANYGAQLTSVDGNYIGSAPDINLANVLSWLEDTGGARFEAEAQKTDTPQTRIANRVREALENGEELNSQKFFAIADEEFGGTRANNDYGDSQATDALELGVNLYLQGKTDANVSPEEAKATLERIQQVMQFVPRHRGRTGNKDLLQQFSTPPAYAYAVSWIANVTDADVVLEPSAGMGGIAIHAANSGATVYANELDPTRAEGLRELPLEKVFTEDAEQIGAILKGKMPGLSVIIMNPPFSRAGLRMGDRMVQGTDRKHIDEALTLLPEGGRLVAIVGAGLHGQGQKMTQWLDNLPYQLVANIEVAREVYRGYGTEFPTRVLVIDKVQRTGTTLVRSVGDLSELIDIAEGVRNARPDRNVESNEDKPNSPQGTAKDGQGPGTTDGTRDTTSPGVSGDADSGAGQANDGQRGSDRGDGVDNGNAATGAASSNAGSRRGGRGSGGKAGKSGRSGGRTKAESTGNASSGKPKSGGRGATDRGRGLTKVNAKSQPRTASTKTELGESTFEVYVPSVVVEGAKPHPAPIVESAAMAAVDAPFVDYEVDLMPGVFEGYVNDEGDYVGISNIQLEAIAMAGAAHEQKLPNGERRGFLIGDGTGVGKAREALGIIMDDFIKRGTGDRRKAVFITKNDGLVKDAVNEWIGVGGDATEMRQLSAIGSGENVNYESGVLTLSYDTLKGEASVQARSQGNDLSRVEQIINWVGEDFDGVIVFDEAHLMANSMDTGTGNQAKGASKRALSGVDLQQRLPNARFVYLSATAATEVRNLAYAERLGLWGPGTSFDSKHRFVNEIEAGGVAAMEKVAADMKAMGMYVARNLSFDDGTENGRVEFDRIQHTLSSDQRRVYDKLSEAWLKVLADIERALDITSNQRGKSRILSAFWGSNQRFWNDVVTTMMAPTLIKNIESDLKAGRSVVIQLSTTKEAATGRAIAGMKEGQTYDEIDASPRRSLMEYVERAFPTQRYETYIDDAGNERSRPVVDSDGKPVHDPRAIAMKEQLLDEIGSLDVAARGPIDMIIDHFGVEMVAEISGRSQRLVKGDDGRLELEKRGKAAARADRDSFMDGKKRVLLFSEAGGTGASYHASLSVANQQRRSHYLWQPGWSAPVAVQGLGRAHRSNQASAPLLHLLEPNLEGYKRFISTIARRLGQLGALTKGQRTAADAGLFGASDNLESTEANRALFQFMSDAVDDNIEGIDRDFLIQRLGMDQLAGGVSPTPEMFTITQFLNRMLNLPLAEQSKVFNEFQSRMDNIVAQAIQDGTLDQGMETLKAERIVKANETIVNEHKTGAKTKLVELTLTHKVKPKSFEDMLREAASYTQGSLHGFVKSNTTGNVAAVINQNRTSQDTNGRTMHDAMFIGVNGNTYGHSLEQLENAQYWENLPREQARELWDKQFRESPTTRESTTYLLTGALLPVWSKIPGTQSRVLRALTTDGETILGRVIPEKLLQRTLDSLGVSSDAAQRQYTPQEAIQAIYQGGTVELANGWKIKKRTIDSEDNIEIIGPDYSSKDGITNAGGFTRRIDYNTRFFIPFNDTNGEVLGEITRISPIASITTPRGGSGVAQMANPTRQSRSSGSGVGARVPGEGIAAADIQKTAERLFDVAIRQGGFSQRAAGIYKWITQRKSPPSPEVIRTAEDHYANIAVIAHEIAHHIDETTKVVNSMPKAVKNEVSGLDYEPQKARAFEGWAEFLRRYMTEPPIDVNGNMIPNPGIDAPQTLAWFESTFLQAHPDVAKAIAEFRQYAQQFANQSVFARIGTMISDRKPQDLRFQERWKQKAKRWVNRLKSNFLDKFHTLKWIQDEAKEKGYKGTGIYDLTMAYFLSASSHATIAFEEGVRALTGRKIGTTKLWEISRHLENDGEYDEAVRYALARHTLYMDEVKPGYNTGVDVDDAQAWIDEARSLGKADRYERFSKELAQFNDDLIMMLVADGALSSEEADKILNYYRDANGSPHYFPLHRVSDLDGSEFAGTSAGFVNLGPAVKGRSKSGSGRQIIDPLDATVTRAIKFYGRAIQARQAHTLAKTLDPKMGGVGGMGGLMDRIPAKRVVNQGTIEEILGTLVESGTIEEDQARAMRIAARILDPANGGMASQKDLEWFANKHQVVDWENNWSDMEDAAKTEPDALAVISLWRPDYTPSAKKRTVMIYDPNGNKLMYEMDNDLYQVATGMQEVQFNSFMRTLRESARYFKSGAVGLSTGFGTANLLRDYWEFQGKANHVQGLKTLGKPWEMLGRYIAEKTKKSVGMKSNDLLIRLYEESGGKVYSVIGHDADGRSIYRRRKTGKSTMSKLGLSITRPMETAENMLNTLQEFIAISDAPPRMADAEAALAEHGFVIRDGSWFDTKAGVPVDTLPESARIAASVAMAEATINFKRIGAAGQYVEAFFPFFNATIQATYRSYQQIKNLKNIGKDTPEGNRALRTLVYLSAIAATGAFYWLFRHDDDDYRNQDGWLRDGYWTWGENGKTYLRIPKPRDFAVVGNVVENMLDAWAHNDARETSEIFKREIAGRIPTGGGMLRGSVETYVANYDYFRGRELEGESVKDLPKQYRTSSYTSRMSDYLGKHFGKILNTSPIQFEHLLSSASGGMYSRWTDTYDAAQDGRIGPEHVPFARGLMMNRQQTRPVGEFYQKKEELTELAATQKIEQEKVDSDVSDKLAHFGWISEVMTALRKGEGKLGKKRSFENEKYITGLARAALGYDEQKSNPNPLSAKDLPEDIRETIDHYRQLAVVGAAERISPRSTYKSDDAYASKLSEIERAESKFKMLNLSLEESKQALIAYWEKQGWPVKEKGVLTDKLQSRFRKLDELFKSK